MAQVDSNKIIYELGAKVGELTVENLALQIANVELEAQVEALKEQAPQS
jgi:predicted ThiF/HesA family dinucleotide-utilizing enzyme